MRLLAVEDFDFRVVLRLRDMGHDVVTVCPVGASPALLSISHSARGWATTFGWKPPAMLGQIETSNAYTGASPTPDRKFVYPPSQRISVMLDAPASVNASQV